MTSKVNLNKFGNSSLTALYAEMSPAQMQDLTLSLLEANKEAQGLISDIMMASRSAPMTPQRLDPFGGLEIQAELGGALARNPEKMAHAMMSLFQGWMGLFQSIASGVEPPRDRRFSDAEWSENPAFDFMRRAWQLNADWLYSLVDTAGSDLEQDSRIKARYFISQFVDAMAPTNLPATNPAALRALAESGGQSLIESLKNARRDIARGNGRLVMTQTDETAFEVGKNIATSKGQVIFRNQLIEVIHYNPTRKKMRERPMLIFPPWINKFYILDLQPANSMVQWLLSKRVNTLVVSWRSADAATKNYTWDDYVEHGIMAAIDAVTEATGSKDLNAIGYCIGGTLLTTALGHMAKTGDTRIHSATYFASQSDFSQAGELKIFTSDKALDQINDVIEEHDGLMPGEMMGETFNWLRPADLVWRYVVDNYMLGKQPKAFDLLYWNADQTNIPGPTHKTYLGDIYNKNAIAEGKFKVFGEQISMRDITVPVYSQASRSDHICPWESIYRGIQNFGGDVQFTLAGSGHIAGVINHPDAMKYQHWTNSKLPAKPGTWLSGTQEHPGSWWLSWWKWLKPKCGDKTEAIQPEDCGLGQAPGQFAAMKLDDIAAGKQPAGPFSQPKRKKQPASKRKSTTKSKIVSKNTAKPKKPKPRPEAPRAAN